MSRTGNDVPWSAKELAVVRKQYPRAACVADVAAIAERLGRSVDAVRHAAKRLRVTSLRIWKPWQDKRLTADWGKVKTSTLAREIGRSPTALKQRARRLGLDAERRYTDEEKQLVRCLYGTATAAAIAERVHGTARAAKAIYRLAADLGLRKCPHWSREEMEEVRAACVAGGTDQEIARRLGRTREQITHIRNRLKIPRNDAAILSAQRRGVKTQYARLGVANGGELRARSYRLYAAESGWPEDLPPRAIQILNVLAEHGPKTAMELAAAIGTRTDLVNPVTGSPKLLTGSARSKLMRGHGTYTGMLAARGLVYRKTRHTTGRGHGRNRLPDLYMLTPAAITIREECLERK